jgi:serine protease Do
MAGKFKIRSPHLVRILTCCTFLAIAPSLIARNLFFFPMELAFKKPQAQGSESGLVRVSIVSRFRGAKTTVEIDGKLLTDYSPVIIQSFSATGIVFDQKGNIMTLLAGYRWLDIQNHDPQVEVSKDGQKWKGKLVGIDQKTGVTVIRLTDGKLKKTPTCGECQVKDGSIVMAPVSSGLPQFRRAQVVSIAMEQESPEPGEWTLTVDRPFPDIGQPILTPDHRVLGFIASQDPMGIRNTIYPISQLVASAERILKTGGDLHAGWLGLFIVDSNPAFGPGLLVQSVELDSPAQNAGFVPGDFLVKYNGEPVRDTSHYIQLVEGSSIGSKANIEIIRRGTPVTLSASIGQRRPQPQGGLASNLPVAFAFPVPGMFSEPAPRNQHLLIGVDTILLDAELADSLQIAVRNGVLVMGVQKGSPADLAGVLVGDVIMAIDNRPITNAPDFVAFMATHNWGTQALLKLNRKGTELIVRVQLSN